MTETRPTSSLDLIAAHLACDWIRLDEAKWLASELFRTRSAVDDLRAQRQQAIDALREVARTDGSSAPHKARIARAALLKLGEQP